MQVRCCGIESSSIKHSHFIQGSSLPGGWMRSESLAAPRVWASLAAACRANTELEAEALTARSCKAVRQMSWWGSRLALKLTKIYICADFSVFTNWQIPTKFHVLRQKLWGYLLAKLWKALKMDEIHCLLWIPVFFSSSYILSLHHLQI